MKIRSYFVSLLLLTSCNVFALNLEEYCSNSSTNKCVNPYGEQLGQFDNIVSFSNCRSECVKNEANNIPAAKLGTKEDAYSGVTWQCVEYARRWWMLELGIRFGSVDTANQIFTLKTATRLKDNKEIKLVSYKNSSVHPPMVGDLLIYAQRKEDPHFQYGHVAAIVGVNLNSGYVDVAEQNYNNKKWDSPSQYSRRIVLKFEDGKYTVYDVKVQDFDASEKYAKEKEMMMGWVKPEL